MKETNNNNVFSKVIPSVISNSDNYSFEQITCFHKPWAILYKSYNATFQDIFLFYSAYYESFMVDNYFGWDQFINNLDNNFLIFAKEILNEKMGLNIDKVYYNNEEGFYKNIEKEIINDSRILVPGDLIQLPYNTQYLIGNHVHYFIIKGFDKKRKIFNILDNMHIDNGAHAIYKDFTLEYERIFKLNLAYFENVLKNENPYFWVIRKSKNNFDFTIRNVLEDHMNVLEKINSKEINLRMAELDLMSENRNDYVKYGKLCGAQYAKIYNYKIVYYDILIDFLNSEGVLDKELEQINDMINKLKSLWDDMRLNIMYFLVKNPEKILDYKDQVINNIEIEKEFRNLLISVIQRIKSTDKVKNIQNKADYSVINNKNANIKINHNMIEIEHSSEQIYGTWIFEDSAPQLLYSFTNDEHVILETKLEVTNTINSPFQSGIIVKLDNCRKYLFGIHGLVDLSIFCPENGEAFQLKNKCYWDNIIYMKIVKIKSKILFYYKTNEEFDWMLIHTENIQFKLIDIGLFSRTWESTSHHSIFYNTKLVVNEKNVDNVFGI